MKEEVRIFLMSGLLEEYAMGLTSPEQNKDIEHYITHYPEVAAAYDEVQVELENYSRSVAQSPSPALKGRIMDNLTVEPSGKSSRTSYINWLGWAAAAVLAILAWQGYQEQNLLRSEKVELGRQLMVLKKDCEPLLQNANRMAFLENRRTMAWNLTGNDNAPDLHLTAFWNTTLGEGHLKVNHLPPPPKGHCYQLWVDVEGVMIPAAVFDGKSSWIPMSYTANIESFNITIEKDGGATVPNVQALVAHTDV